ncbi:radical SAM protein [Streptococcus equi subsp. zooepidemicus]|uniref:radical SAM protein n=12 Tax=Streptococcus equi TaxID=1336 RepID=UPI0002174D53|nr:radical SAM protein [Streptococcus equi]AEJ25746.1 heme biosynthesis protein [Streptococcus equi subsp. zooepidemicus ATCC 35246]AIA68596.1 hypothetical protein Q426_01850 [Streptococcus equi subsp. zooepidemicus CY]MBR7776577.1 radical SAM protein [Streptococcus equi subsp. zooepidemicus]MCD3402894.1 radical SAM protein [Streptococcus equi subsp. zooepidemicus]MCD3441662.1 radical SAM protein [Streptococcus equi subsp. zooepidemicus]
MKDKINNLNDVISLYRQKQNLFSVTIELTSFCNWHCKHCYIGDYSFKGFELDNFKKLLIDLRKMGTYEIVLTGGEIFAHPDCFSMIRIAREMFFNVILYSNISMLTSQKIEELSKLNIDYITCTIFSLKSEIHDYITGVSGSLNRSLKNLQLLKQKNINVEIKTPIMKRNKHCFEDIYNFCKINNIRYKVDAQIVPNRIKKDGLDYSLSLKELVKIQSRLDKINGVQIIEKSENYLTCKSLRLSLYITSIGGVQPCSLYNYSIANVNFDNIKDIWDDFCIRKLSNYTLKDSDHCSTCSLSKYCTQCPGIALSEGNNSTSCSKICQKTAIARRLNYEAVN